MLCSSNSPRPGTFSDAALLLRIQPLRIPPNEGGLIYRRIMATAIDKTYQEINRFMGVANDWLERNPKETKLRYALKKEMKAATVLLTNYQDQLEDANIEHCAVDDKGVILRDERGNFRFTKEGLRARNKQINTLFKSTVKIEPYYATDLSDCEFTEDEEEVFAGFVLRPAVDEKSSVASAD